METRRAEKARGAGGAPRPLSLPTMPFDFNGAEVRAASKDGEPWFVAADVCRVLDIGNPRQAVSTLDDDERDTVTINDGIRGAGNPTLNIVNESGLYSLILRSRKPEAKAFK